MMFNFINWFLDKFYDMIAYHVEYELDENENIVKIEKNAHFGSTQFVYTIIAILIIVFSILMLGVVGEKIVDKRDQKIFLNHYNVQEVCFDNNTWVECLSLGNTRRIRISLDESGAASTLYIKEE